MNLTDAQTSTLARAVSLQDEHGCDGVFPRGSAQMLMFSRLEDFWLLKFVGFGGNVDGDTDREVPIYEITDAGRAALERARSG